MCSSKTIFGLISHFKCKAMFGLHTNSISHFSPFWSSFHFHLLSHPDSTAFTGEGGVRLYWDALPAFLDIGGPKSYK